MASTLEIPKYKDKHTNYGSIRGWTSSCRIKIRGDSVGAYSIGRVSPFRVTLYT